MSDFAFGIQPNKEGQFVLYEDGKEVEAYHSPEAALNAVILEARSKLSAETARAEKAEDSLSVAIDWIKGIPCLGRPGLLEDKQAILAALKEQG